MDTGKWAVVVWAAILAIILYINQSAAEVIVGFFLFLVGFAICYIIVKWAYPRSRDWGAVKWGLALPLTGFIILFGLAFLFSLLGGTFAPAAPQEAPTQPSQPVVAPPASPAIPDTISPPSPPPVPSVAGSGGSVDRGSMAKVYSGIDPPYALADGSQVTLTRNDKATNPTWAQVKSFITHDQTDQIQYSLGSFVCSNYAEEIYDNAEAHGIRAGFVAISFQDGSMPHALNAFETTDRGLVFIDSTMPLVAFNTVRMPGEKEFGISSNNDKIGYLQVGQPYGIVSMSTNWGTKYSDYVAWQKALASFKTELANYNAEIESYNAKVKAYNVNPTSEAEYYSLKAESTQLDQESAKLDADGNKLGGFWEPPNDEVPVSQIEIYW